MRWKSLVLGGGLASWMLFEAACGARSSLPYPDSGAGGDAASPAVACSTGTITLTKADPTLMLVLDRSGSMDSPLGASSGGASRWEILTQALGSTLPAVDDTMEIGALLYPEEGALGPGSHGSFSCEVPGSPDLSPKTGNVSALLSIMGSTFPAGATPTAAALDSAASALSSVRAATAARALVLATDGGPNCNSSLDADSCECISGGQHCHDATMCLDDTNTVDRIAHYEKLGLPTYVIGILDPDDTQFTSVLDAMAKAGGRAKTTGTESYYPATSASELNDALSVIRDQVACTYLTTSVPDVGGTISVLVNGTTLVFDTSGAAGWSWANQRNGEIVLAPDACAVAAAAPAGTIVAKVICAADLVDAGSDGGDAGEDGGAP